MKYKIFDKVKLHHIALLTFTFFVLDVGSTWIGLQMGATEVGVIAKYFDFTGIALLKFAGLLVLLFSYVRIVNDHELFADRMIYFISGISMGVFIVNIHQVLYYLWL